MDTNDPVVRGVLRAVADKYGKDTSLGMMARGLLAGEVTLRDASRTPWFTQDLLVEYARAREAERQLPERERARAAEAAASLYEHAGSSDQGDGATCERG